MAVIMKERLALTDVNKASMELNQHYGVDDAIEIE
jgi:hypothetical protein